MIPQLPPGLSVDEYKELILFIKDIEDEDNDRKNSFTFIISNLVKKRLAQGGVVLSGLGILYFAESKKLMPPVIHVLVSILQAINFVLRGFESFANGVSQVNNDVTELTTALASGQSNEQYEEFIQRNQGNNITEIVQTEIRHWGSQISPFY